MSWRRTVSVIAGVVAAGLVMMVLEGLGMALFPLPDSVDATNPEAIPAAMDAGLVPFGAMVMVVVGWCLAAFAGGMLAAYLGEREPVRLGLTTGGILMVLALVNLRMIPHPVWMLVCGVVVWLPFAFVGAKAAAFLPADSRDEVG